MQLKLKNRFENFINNDKDYPILVGFVAGFYPLVFFYSNNFDSVLSVPQFAFFGTLFLLVPILFTFFLFQLFSRINLLKKFKKQLLFVLLFEITAIFLSQVLFLTLKKKLLLALLILLIFLSFKLFNHYKKFIVLVFVMSLFPLFKIGTKVYSNIINTLEWLEQPDAIVTTTFKSRPNIYYIQPDGYVNQKNMQSSIYDYDNSDFDAWLTSHNFVHYEDFRSNYESTLYSNASCFGMKHHLYKEFADFKYARDIIVGDNPVMKVLKNNGYKSFFITERPYLLINRPELAYDCSNFSLDELPYFRGWSGYKEITSTIKVQIAENKTTNNFFFIEKFTPSHIATYKNSTSTIESERIEYLERIKEANLWLKDVISFIDKNDPDGIIIIAADHGGFVGFEYALEATKKITDKELLYSIFGAKLAIKWNSNKHSEFDTNLKSSVNLFRVVFAHLSENKELLKHLQSDASYNLLDENTLKYDKVFD